MSFEGFTATGVDERARAYARLATGGPVHRVRLLDGNPAWLVLGHAEARAALTDPRLARTTSDSGLVALRHDPQAYRSVGTDLLRCDGADHARLRRLVTAAFTARRVAALEPRVQEIADDLLDAMAAQPEVDLLPAYARPLSMAVICELLGIPEVFRGPLQDSTAARIAGPTAGEAAYLDAIRTQAGLARDLVALKRREPGDDLLSALVAVRDATDRLSEDELTSMLLLLVLGGYFTTAHAIGNAALLLLRHRDPGVMVADAVEEMLRLDPPEHTMLPLRATAPVCLGETTIATGDIVMVSQFAANRDPSQVVDPARFDAGREYLPHLAFGHGIHRCLGAALARMEVRIALTSLLARFPRLRLSTPVEGLQRPSNQMMHGLAALPIRLCD